MSKIIATRAIRGAHKIVERAELAVDKVLTVFKEKGKGLSIAFPDTAYYLPFIYAMTGVKVQKLGDVLPILEHARSLLPEIPSEKLHLPYLGDALDAGMATLFAEEIIEALKYSFPEGEDEGGGNGKTPTHDFWIGFTNDMILREQGIKLVDGRMPGFAAIVGCAPTNEEAKKIILQLQERSILVFMSGTSVRSDGKKMCIAEQLAEEGVQMGWDVFLVPHGTDITSTIYAANFAARAAMTFGGITPGAGDVMKKAREILLYNKDRVFAFVIALGEVDDEKHANAAGAINFGFPVVADTDIDQVLPTGICTYEHVVSPVSREEIVAKGIEIRGLKVKVTKVPIPVPFGAAFEGERIRKEQTYVEFGSKYSTAFEWLRMKNIDEVTDGKIEIIGPDIDQIKVEVGKPEKLPFAMPLGLVVEVAGRKMQKDFESILERQIHHFINFANGIFHMGQRNQNWIRISKDAFKAGFRLKHFGEILHAKFLEDFPALVDKVQIFIYTDETEIKKLLPEALQAFEERDMRLAGLTDESVDVFYSCTLCQSYAPNHVCIITAEKLGLCGAYNWLDGKAAYEINPRGMNQPVYKGECLDAIKGEWKGVNEFVYMKSNKTVERFCNYSIMEFPTTSCGCFECIIAVLPECNGFMVVNRGYTGMTPVGMTFTTLAGSVGGGNQTPGFLGVGRLYLVSKKFLVPEGGLARIIWMTKELKEILGDKLKKRAEEIHQPDLPEKIADETITTDAAQLLEYLQKVNHPAISLPPLM
ncbi:MAG: acetyl-CoA decarbonylase/synthase complex subunit alpha/beta [Elusimicrobiota bacterium]|nr:acetyl-CoA decarbonylase/synthase complex subunit alpha/beta [Elusimicrobiota bacterium]